MKLGLMGLGAAVPSTAVPQQRAAELALSVLGLQNEDGWHVQEIFRNAGIRKRHSIVLDQHSGSDGLTQSFFPPVQSETAREHSRGPGTAERMDHYHRHAIPLAADACRAALADSRTCASDVTHLIAATCTGFGAPGVDCGLIDELRLGRDIARTQIGFMGCHAAFNGLRVANAFIEADPTAVVLMCAVELCSLHFDYGAALDRVIANALFADGAAAIVGKAAPSAGECWRLTASGSVVVPNTAHAMTWRIGDHGFEMSLSRKIPALIEEHLESWLAQWLATLAMDIKDIASWAVHPGGPKIIDAVEEALSLADGALEESRALLADYGNMSSPTILFLIDRLRKKHARRPCVALGFGPGLTIEAMLFH